MPAPALATTELALVPSPETAVSAAPTAEDLVEADLLIEDVSIDGMCGVY